MSKKSLTTNSKKLAAFRRKIWRFYRQHKREFAWRPPSASWRSGSPIPYHVLVSEVMLQQTQTYRVEPKFRQFTEQFPNIETLASAPLSQILKIWQGLGYNRRALQLKKLAQIVVADYGGKLPQSPDELVKLPGIGRATAGAIAAFAYNQPVVFIETNIRRVYIHDFFPRHAKVSDRNILSLVEQTLDRVNPHTWYWALMDYGAHLAKTTENPNRRSSHYAKQPKFAGSNRQLRGKTLSLLVRNKSMRPQQIARELKKSDKEIQNALAELTKEGFIKKSGTRYRLD